MDTDGRGGSEPDILDLDLNESSLDNAKFSIN